jgi:AAHS family 4-hydroxybenzoate transporter-like MFS transporter
LQIETDIDEFLDRPAARSFCNRVVFMCGILTAFEAMDVYVLGVIISPLTTGLGVSLATFGIVFTFQAIGQIAGTYFIAPLADKVGRRPVILYCTLGFGIMTISSAASPNLQIFILQRIVAFFLIGGAVPNLFAIASEFGARKRRHRNTLIIGSFHGIGAGLAFIVGGLLLDFGWRAPLLACGVLTLISLALAFFFMPESMRFLLTKPEREDQLRKLVQVIDASVNFSSIKAPAEETATVKPGVSSLFSHERTPITLLLWIIGALTISMIGAVAQWTPTYLNTYGGVDLKQAAFMTSLSGPAGVLWPIALIWLMNRLGAARAMALNYIFAACALGSFALITIYPGVGWLIACGYGAFLGGATSGFYTLCTMAYPTTLRATGMSWAVGAGRVFSLFVPVLGGLAIASAVKPQVIAIALATPLLIVMVATLFLRPLLEKAQKFNT